jgi:chromosome segregation ATPase
MLTRKQPYPTDFSQAVPLEPLKGGLNGGITITEDYGPIAQPELPNTQNCCFPFHGEDLLNQINELQNQAGDLLNQNNKLQNQVGDLLNQNNELQNQAGELQAQVNSLQVQKEIDGETINNFKESLKTSAENLAASNSKDDAAKEQVNKLKAQLKQAKLTPESQEQLERICDLQTELDILTEQLYSAKAEINKLKSHLKLAKATHDEAALLERLAKSEEKVRLLEAELKLAKTAGIDDSLLERLARAEAALKESKAQLKRRYPDLSSSAPLLNPIPETAASAPPRTSLGQTLATKSQTTRTGTVRTVKNKRALISRRRKGAPAPRRVTQVTTESLSLLKWLIKPCLWSRI